MDIENIDTPEIKERLRQIYSPDSIKRLRQWQKEYKDSGNTEDAERIEKLLDRLGKIMVINSPLQSPDPEIIKQLSDLLVEEQDIIKKLSEDMQITHNLEFDPFPTRIPKADIKAFMRDMGDMAERENASTVWYEEDSQEITDEVTGTKEDTPSVPWPDENAVEKNSFEINKSAHSGQKTGNQAIESEEEAAAEGAPDSKKERRINQTAQIAEDPFSSSIPKLNLKAFKQAMMGDDTPPESWVDWDETADTNSEDKNASPGSMWETGANTHFEETAKPKPTTVAPGLTPAQKATVGMQPLQAQESMIPASTSAAMFGRFLANVCGGIKSIFKPIPKSPASLKDNMAACSPLPEEIFSQKTQHLLRTWNFRRAHFEQSWTDVHNDQLAIESCIGRIRENPLILRAMEDIRAAGGNEAEEALVRKDLAKSMDDKFSEYATSLRRDVDELTRGMQQFKKNASIAVEASGKEPLDRFACPEALEKNFKTFFQDVLDKPELQLIADEHGETLYTKAAKIVQSIKDAFATLKNNFMRLISGNGIEGESPAAMGKPVR